MLSDYSPPVKTDRDKTPRSHRQADAFDRLFTPTKRNTEPAPTTPADSRIDWFTELVRALDATNTSAMLRAQRELRRLGLSVVPVTPKTGGTAR